MMKQHSSLFLRVTAVITALMFAAAATILIGWVSLAAPGASPTQAVTIVSGANTGVLAPGEERWFRLFPNRFDRFEQSVVVVFTPVQQRHVGFEIFTQDTIELFQRGGFELNNLGAGQVVSLDNNPFTSELFWTGWIYGDQNYYIRLVNPESAPITYWLYPERNITPPMAEPVPTSTPVATPTPDQSIDGTSPWVALPFNPEAPTRNSGRLNPHQTMWYRLDPHGDSPQEAGLTLFMTPGNGHLLNGTTLDIFTMPAVQNWPHSIGNNIGAGAAVERDGNPMTGERAWHGWLVAGEVYYVRLHNGNDAPVDYWLFPGQVHNVLLGQ
ncbi:MAG: hypothetical protein F6K39_36550 [Okeania sp. SIO3B3]|nr:hypothetical protein [Okeania sp. SIO3B3]